MFMHIGSKKIYKQKINEQNLFSVKVKRGKIMLKSGENG